MYITRRTVIAISVLAVINSGPGIAETVVGVTNDTIKVGGIWPFSGPASAWGVQGKSFQAYVEKLNDEGGINGRSIDFIALDDAYSPPKTVEQVRRLVESDEVAFIATQLGTATNSATIRYVNDMGVPHTFIGTGASKFTDFMQYPWTTTAAPSYETEAKVFARYAQQEFPGERVAILYQNDDLGQDYVNGFKAVYGDKFGDLVSTASYEVTDPTIDSQIVNFRSRDAHVLMLAAASKFAAQAIRKSREIGWDSQIFVSQASSSISTTLEPAGLDNAIGVISSAWTKDISDPKNADDEDVIEYLEWMQKYNPGGDPKDFQYEAGYIYAHFMEELIRLCGDDLSREHIRDVSHEMPYKSYPLILDGITAGTSATSNQMLTNLQMQRFNGVSYEPVGGVVSAAQD